MSNPWKDFTPLPSTRKKKAKEDSLATRVLVTIVVTILSAAACGAISVMLWFRYLHYHHRSAEAMGNSIVIWFIGGAIFGVAFGLGGMREAYRRIDRKK